MTRKQQLFQRFPLDGAIVVAGEEATTPYHIYDGTILSLVGTVDGEVAARLLAAEHLEPVLNTDGRALAAIWICDFTKANLGAHHELQISLFATRRKVRPLQANAFAFYRALKVIPDLMMVCHGLWNNTQRVVQYNSEHLLLNARLAKSEVDFSGDNWIFRFCDADGGLIADGSVPATRRQPTADVLKIALQMGLRSLLDLLRAPCFKLPVVNTRRQGDVCNHVCTTYTACDKPLIRSATDSDLIAVREPTYAELDFRITFVQVLKDIGFIFMRPTPL
ncbi:MAG: hypothetical protein REI95_02335 [Oxalicibacterium faecigallinarum]|uniref:hypothetical protein n=1 Tax=Oxalicibacterium faecigallinarum TaxID=573741 RepID=UPI00280900FD|nr:hypothetical protein [Oxalicibacterium faecigallinarum]MDQ7968457.1 hypothetical protein [Oxalicibacterium faecigallinarum]